MNLPSFGVRKPVTNLMIFTTILILALYSLTRLGIDLMPEIEPPALTVISVYPGAGPEDVEIKVTEPLENQLATTPGIEKITSRSFEGVSILTLKFVWKTNLDAASNDIRDRIEMSKRYLPDIPDEMDNPFIFKFNTAMIPILFLGFTADNSYPELFDLIDKKIADPLRQIPGVGTVQLQGGLERQINIFLDRQRLEAYNLSITEIFNTIRQENVTQPVGSLKAGLTDYLIRLPGEFTTPEEINSVILGKSKNSYIYLKDVARVEDSFKEVTYVMRINEHPGLMMMIQKQTGVNTVDVAEKVKARMEQLANTLPPDVKIFTVMDNSKDIVNAIDSLKSNVWVAIVLVILVVWFFLRLFLPSLIIALTIPFSLLITFIYLFTCGKTINVISLSSVAIASGMVVDNAIVVVDNVFRHLERGERPIEASIYGTSEMFLSISASTLTTVVVFAPMLFISGVIGIMFSELAMIIIVTLMASLFTAATFTPMLCSKWMKTQSSEKRQSIIFGKLYNFSERMFKSWEEFYAKALAWCLGHKKSVIAIFSITFVLSLLLMKFVGNEFVPEEDSGDLRITAYLPIGTRLEESDLVSKKIEEILKSDVPEAIYTYVGCGRVPGMGRIFGRASGTHVTSGGVKLVPKQKRKRSDKEIAHDLRLKIQKIPGVLKTDVATGNPMSQIIMGGGGKRIQIEIIGHSFEDTDSVANQIKQVMENTPGAVDISISRELKLPELRIKIDREKASSLGLSMSNISNTVRTYIEGSTASKYREKGETYDIFIRLEEHSRSKISDIENLTILSPFTKKQIKLSNIAKIYETAGPEAIERQNRERVVRVECNNYQISAGKLYENIKAQIEKMTMPSDTSINYGGEAEEQAKAFKDLFLLLVLGICLVYMVMAAQFESLLDPFIVMFSVPFTFTGVILGFLVTRSTLNVLSFLGIVMLMGIVVNNAIVLISYINILRARGYSMIDAVTLGGKDRLRPVLMTTITTLVGLLPLAISKGEGSELWQPLGITMLSGLTVSTVITMLFVPTLYALVEQKIKKAKT